MIELVKESHAWLTLPEAKTKSLHLRSAPGSRMMRSLPSLRPRQQHILAQNSQARDIKTSCSRKLQEINKTVDDGTPIGRQPYVGAGTQLGHWAARSQSDRYGVAHGTCRSDLRTNDAID